jgi:hypothetical protein
MSTPTSEYMILFRSTDWDKGLSPEEMQKIMARTMAWFDGLAEEGKLKAAQPLHDEGKIITGKQTRTVADGPFAESKESIGGYLLLRVDTIEEAVEIAKSWPLLDVGATVEVRPVAVACPSFEKHGVTLAHVTA